MSRDLTGRTVTAIYRCSNPPLQLTWEWRARLGAGPIEHTIEIDNLDNRVIDLPLQDSLAFDWVIPSQQELRHMWVEKGAERPGSCGDTRCERHGRVSLAGSFEHLR